MPAEALSPATTASFHVQRSLRHCLSSVAELLYESGHVLETITLIQRGLSHQELISLSHQHPRWALCQQVLEESDKNKQSTDVVAKYVALKRING